MALWLVKLLFIEFLDDRKNMQFDYRPSSFPPWEVAGPGAEGSEEKGGQ